MIKGIIFDLDGTLLDSMWVWNTLGETYLRSLGVEPDKDINELFKNFSISQATEHYKQRYGVNMTTEELRAGINKRVENNYFYDVNLKEGVRQFLEELYKKNVKMCIATATDKYQVMAAVKRLKIDKYFSNIITCIEVGCGKDQPIIYREALKKLGTTKKDTLVFEDSLHAIKTAKKDGFLTVGVFDIYNNDKDEILKYSNIYLNNYINMNEFWKYIEEI